MKYSPKSPIPQCLSDWLSLANADWTPTYSDLRGAERRGVVQSLLREQGFVCAYCGRGLKEDGTDAHIDHFWPQQHFGPQSGNDRSLDYFNFFLSCGPNKHPEGHAERLPVTCGESKAHHYNQTNFVIPSDPTCEVQFRYGSIGTVVEMPQGNVAAKNMMKWLNLTDPSLEYERSIVLQDIEADIVDNKITSTNKNDYIMIWRSPDAAGRLKSFGHTAARYIEEEM